MILVLWHLFIQRCMKRLHESRSELFAKKRRLENPSDNGEGNCDGGNDLIRSVMSSELQALRSEENIEVR